MKKTTELLMFGVVIVLLFTLPFLFKLRAISSLFDLSAAETSNIANSINGMTAPVISLFSAVLLYKALTAQLESNKHQRQQLNAQMVEYATSDLEKLVNEYQYGYCNPAGSYIKSKGIDAVGLCLTDITNKFSHNPKDAEWPIEDFWKIENILFETSKTVNFCYSLDMPEASFRYFESRLSLISTPIFIECSYMVERDEEFRRQNTKVDNTTYKSYVNNCKLVTTAVISYRTSTNT